MSQLFKSEFYKLIRQKSFWGLTVFSCLLSSILLLDGSFPTDARAFFDHALYALPLLYVLIMVFVALFVGKDFDTRTIQAYVCAGHKRGNILLAKVIVLLVGSSAILFFPVILHTVTGYILYEIPGSGTTPIIMKSAMVFWIIIAMGMLPCLFVFLIKDVGKTLTLLLILYFIMLFLLNGRHYRLMAFCLPMGQLRLLSLNQLSGFYVSAFLTDCIWILVCYSLAYWNFSRSDLK